MDQYEFHLMKLKLNYVRIDGQTSAEKKHEHIQTFQRDESCTIALLSIMATYQGITLTAASTVVFAEFYWTPGIMQ